jgi:hypothetical protein
MRTSGNSDSQGFVNQFVVYALVAICTASTFGLGIVWIRHQISVAANANKVLVSSIDELQRQIEETDAAIAAEQDPAVLNRRNTEWQLGLVPPGETQVRRVSEDPVTRLAAMHNRTLFGEGPEAVSFRIASAH